MCLARVSLCRPSLLWHALISPSLTLSISCVKVGGLTYLTTEPGFQEQCPTQSSSLREKGRRNDLAWVVKLIMMSLTKEKLFGGRWWKEIFVDVRSSLIENRFCWVLNRFQLELSFLF